MLTNSRKFLPENSQSDGLTIPPGDLFLLLAREGLTYVRQLAAPSLAGTSVHLCEHAGEKVVLKALASGPQDGLGAKTLARERAVLEAELPSLPKLYKALIDESGKLEGVLRTFHPGAPVVTLVGEGHLSSAHFSEALTKLLELYEKRGFFLEDTDASNFIVAAEDGIVNPHAIHRTLMLIDPEALSPMHEGLRLASDDGVVGQVLKSLDQQVERARARRRAA